MNTVELTVRELLRHADGVDEKRILVLRPDESVPGDGAPYNAVVCVGCLETQADPSRYLSEAGKLLVEGGQLFVFADNRLGLKYFSGELDPFTNGFGNGPEGYNHVYTPKGRCYALEELKGFLAEAGFPRVRAYSLLPGAEAPRFVIAEDFRPSERMSIRYTPEYRSPDTVFLEEEYVIDSLLANRLLPGMADGLLLEAAAAPFPAAVEEIVFSSDRRREYAMQTTVLANGTVEKRPLYPEGFGRPEMMAAHERMLRERGIRTVRSSVRSDGDTPVYVTEYTDAPLANAYLQDLLLRDKDTFVREMDRFREQILSASELLPGPGHIQKTAFPDMVPLNCFVVDGEYVFFDQEFSRADYPADSIVARSLLIVYELDSRREQTLPRSFFFERYGLTEDLDRLLTLAREFTDELAAPGGGETGKPRDPATTQCNRHRMNYSEELFEKLTYNPVAGLEHKDLYLFGTGPAVSKFIEMYQRDYEIRAVLLPVLEPDISEYDGYPVLSVTILRELDPGDYRVVICSPDYDAIRSRLAELGTVDCVVYHPGKVYPGRQATKLYQQERSEKKPYHIGYVAGVFDLYHLGHLKLFQRAKAMCDYLIVGVVTDAGVRDFKKTEPFIPFEERIEMVRGCRYVDEAVEIPYFHRGTIEAFEKYHFDVQFSGSDYAHEPLWLYHKAWLEERGAAMVFFPYTEGTSSSKIKGLIERNLL